MINKSIKKLICYGLEKKLFEREDQIFVTNKILELLKLDSFKCEENFENIDLEETLKEILDFAVSKNIIGDSITERDLFDTAIMATMLPRPSEVIKEFNRLYALSPKEATDYYYNLSQNSDYIRRYRIKKDVKWISPTEYGDMDITINLSKPEKDPKAIAAARNAVKVNDSDNYPKCMLCRECEGYAGRLDFPARQNHRIIPITINNSDWCFQYSPYVYYNEHCIVFNSEHSPMAINHDTFRKLIDFVKAFPHYFVGSNADLPIVGGSILTHDHFQGGDYTFAMAKAEVETEISFNGFDDVKAGIVKWPMSVIRLSSENSDRLLELACKILDAWKGYTDKEAFIFAETDGFPHNTITPIARKNGENFELDLVLRNNITTDEHPSGLYHSHAEHHHIKRENIGLIEVMGLAVLPARLKNEMALLAKAILNGEDLRSTEVLAQHADWAEDIISRYDINQENIDDILKKEIGIVFSKVLEQCGVFARNQEGKKAFLKFAESVK